MKKIFEKLIQVEGNSVEQVMDLALFIGYFGICLYAGGVAYETNYNNYFSLSTNVNLNDSNIIVMFVTKVLSQGLYWIITSTYIVLFIFLYYLCRYILRPWIGYFVLSLLFYTTFLACNALGGKEGMEDAIKDGFKDTTTLPVVKISDAKNLYSQGNFRLLNIDENNFYLFEPAGVRGSVLQIKVISREQIKYYEVTVK